MSETTNHERWQEDVAAYMLGALEPGRAQELERHAEGCERCRAEIRWLTPALDALPESIERQPPPPELRARVMAEVRADLGEAEAEPALATDAAGSGVAGWLRSLVSGPMGWRPAAGLAAAALVIVAVVGFAVGGGLGDGSGGTDVYVAGQAPGVTAKVVTEDGGAALHLANVGQLPEERVLEAWVQRDGEVEPVEALFVPDHEGNATTTIEDMDGVEVVMVTTEPPGGSESPTSSPMVTVPISS